MAPRIKVREKDRDENFGILKKEVTVFNVPPFETPTKSLKNLITPNIPSTMSINEVIKRISPRTINSIEKGIESPRRTIMSKFVSNKLNLTIFDLKCDSVPERDEIKLLANYWYAASQSTLFLPTVKTGLLKEDRKLSEKKIEKYVGMMRDLIEITEAIGNFKVFIGTIPLMPIKYSRPIIELYHEKGITAFAIDAGTKDFLNHITDFRSILTEINEKVPLYKAFIYACNLGIPQFESDRARADDFLSLFAYVDALGSTFKTRGGPGMHVRKAPPRTKKFLRNDLCYEYFRRKQSLTDFNQREQLKEANLVREATGKRKMQTYLSSKKAVDNIALKHLGYIAKNVRIS